MARIRDAYGHVALEMINAFMDIGSVFGLTAGLGFATRYFVVIHSNRATSGPGFLQPSGASVRR